MARRSPLGVATAVALALPSSGSPQLLVRGQPVDPDTFSLTTLRTSADRELVEVSRHEEYVACMAAKGFDEEPGPEASDAELAAYSIAGIGDDPPVSTVPEPRVIEIADGVRASVAATWTPQSCIYQAYAALDVDAFVHEAARQQMQILVVQADQAAVADLEDVAATWAACLGERTVDPQDLLNTLDRGDVRNPYGEAATGCLTDDLAAKARRIRAEHHLAVAAEHQSLVDAWVRIIDTETAAARRLSS